MRLHWRGMTGVCAPLSASATRPVGTLARAERPEAIQYLSAASRCCRHVAEQLLWCLVPLGSAGMTRPIQNEREFLYDPGQVWETQDSSGLTYPDLGADQS